MENRKKGAILLIISTVSFAMVNIFVKLLKGIPLMETIFIRNVINVGIAYWMVKKSDSSLKCADTPATIRLLVRSLIGVISLYFNMYAASNANQAEVTTRTRMAPYLTIVLAAIFLKESIFPYQYGAMAVAFAGVLVVVGKISFNSALLPLAAAFVTAILSAAVKIILRTLKGKAAPSTTVFYYAAFSVIFALPATIVNFVVPTPLQAFYLIMVGISAMVAQITMSTGFQLVPAGEGSLYDLAGIPAAAILAFFILGESIKIKTIIGGTLIIIAAIILFIGGNKQAKKENP